MQRQIRNKPYSVGGGNSGSQGDDEDDKKVQECFKRLRDNEAKRKKAKKPEKEEAEEVEEHKPTQGEGLGKGSTSETTTSTTVSSEQVVPDRDNSGVPLGSVHIQGQEYDVYGEISPYTMISIEAQQIAANLQRNNNNIAEGLEELKRLSDLSSEQRDAISDYKHSASAAQELISKIAEGMNNMLMVSPIKTAMTIALVGGVGFLTLYFVKKAAEASGTTSIQVTARTILLVAILC